LIDCRISATASLLGFALRLPLPRTRTLTASVHVVLINHEDGVDFHLFGALDLPHCSRRMAELILSMEKSRS